MEFRVRGILSKMTMMLISEIESYLRVLAGPFSKLILRKVHPLKKVHIGTEQNQPTVRCVTLLDGVWWP